MSINRQTLEFGPPRESLHLLETKPLSTYTTTPASWFGWLDSSIQLTQASPSILIGPPFLAQPSLPISLLNIQGQVALHSLFVNVLEKALSPSKERVKLPCILLPRKSILWRNARSLNGPTPVILRRGGRRTKGPGKRAPPTTMPPYLPPKVLLPLQLQFKRLQLLLFNHRLKLELLLPATRSKDHLLLTL